MGVTAGHILLYKQPWCSETIDLLIVKLRIEAAPGYSSHRAPPVFTDGSRGHIS